MSFTPEYRPVPKPAPRVRAKLAKRTAEAAEMRSCYRVVDERDGGRCRVCRKRGNPRATSLLDRLHRHHLIYRSRGGEHIPSAVASICAECHAEIHVEGTLRLTGDANARNGLGQLAGIEVSRLTEAGWKVEKFC